MFCWGGKQIYPQVQSLGLKSKASPFLGECGRREHRCLLRLGAGSRSQFPGPFYFLDCQERDPEGRRTAPPHWQGLWSRASLWKSRLKLPAAVLRPRASARRLAACNQRRKEEVVQVSHKSLSFHGGCGSGCSLMSRTTTSDHILFIKLSLTRGNGRLRLSRLTPLLVQTKPCQRILGILQNYKI